MCDTRNVLKCVINEKKKTGSQAVNQTIKQAMKQNQRTKPINQITDQI